MSRRTLVRIARGLHWLGDELMVAAQRLETESAATAPFTNNPGHHSRHDDVLSFADLSLDLRTHEARRGDRPILLTRTEFALLELLMRHPGQVVSREQIIDEVWGSEFGTTSPSNTLSVYIGYLRRKTEAAGRPRLIRTIHGVGYTIRL
jgi:two-component system, OmpR family, response regulator MprA